MYENVNKSFCSLEEMVGRESMEVKSPQAEKR